MYKDKQREHLPTKPIVHVATQQAQEIQDYL